MHQSIENRKNNKKNDEPRSTAVNRAVRIAVFTFFLNIINNSTNQLLSNGKMIFHPLEMVNRGQPWSTAVNRLVYIAVFPYFIQFTQVYGYQTNYLQKICPFIGEPRLTTVNRLVLIAVFPYFTKITLTYGYQTNVLITFFKRNVLITFFKRNRLVPIYLGQLKNIEENRNFDQTVDRG